MNQLIDLTQLHSRNAGVNTGLRLAFSDQQQQQHHRQRQNSVSPQSSIGVSIMSEELSSQINQQQTEIEHFLQIQGEEFRRTLAEKRQRHYCALLEAAEETMARRLKDKDAVADKALWRKAELEARVAQVSVEAELWRARATAQEAEAAALQTQLQHAIVSAGAGAGASGGVSQEATGETADAESAYVDPERVVVVSGPGCKVCGKRVASVVLLPCRHLCVCSGCDGVVSACPLCLSLRSSSIEVHMS